jgi:hypothetical protein
LIIVNVKLTILFISRDVPVTTTFDVTLQAVYPPQCFDILQCKRLFRQRILSLFRTDRKFPLSIPLVDGQIISFEAYLDYIIEYYGEYEHASNDCLLG